MAMETTIKLTRDEIINDVEFNLADLDLPTISPAERNRMHTMVVGVRQLNWALASIDLGKHLHL